MIKSLFPILCMAIMLIGCDSGDEEIELNSDPGISFLDVENDGYMVTLAAQTPPQGQTGTWKIYSGLNGLFEDLNDPNTIFSGEPGEMYHLGWEVSLGNNYESSSINVSFKPLKPIIYNTNTDTLHNNISLYLEAEAPEFGAEGRWEIVNGLGGRIEDFQNPQAQFVGKTDHSYTLRWTLSYGASEESTEFSFRTDTLKAHAGVDRLDILTPKDETKYYSLEGFLPAGATGNWEIIDGENGTVHSPTNPNSLFDGAADSVYTLKWTVQLDEYLVVDTVKLRFRGKWGVWTDPRDNQSYRYIEVEGVQWMAENYNYAYNAGSESWHYGYGERSYMSSGNPVDSEEDMKRYGRLYLWGAAMNAAPEGWRMPSPDEYNTMVHAFGGFAYAGEKFIVDGDSGLDLIAGGGLILTSLNDPALRNEFYNQDVFGGFWTSDGDHRTADLFVFYPNGAIGAAISQQNYAFSVRYIRDIN